MVARRRLLIYAIGLEPLTARALYADLRGADIRRRRPLCQEGPRRRGGPKPDVVVLDVSVTVVAAELQAAWDAWGDRLVIVGVGRLQPYARVWRCRHSAERVEIGPGFLDPYLAAPSAVCNCDTVGRPRAAAGR